MHQAIYLRFCFVCENYRVDGSFQRSSSSRAHILRRRFTPHRKNVEKALWCVVWTITVMRSGKFQALDVCSATLVLKLKNLASFEEEVLHTKLMSIKHTIDLFHAKQWKKYPRIFRYLISFHKFVGLSECWRQNCLRETAAPVTASFFSKAVRNILSTNVGL